MRDFKYGAVVCGIARDEDRYIVEWIAYHLSIGFDHIFLYDNLSVRPVASLIKRRALLDKVTVIRWPSYPGQSAQQTAYYHFLHTYRDWVEWAAVIDLDEFIHLKQDASISAFLARFPEASAVSINWRIFGSSGETSYRRRPMIKRFQRASELEFDANILVKTIHRLPQTRTIHLHCGEYVDDALVVSPDGTTIAAGNHLKQEASNFAIAQINHYFVKSRDEWAVKNVRGYPDGTVRQPDMFEAYDRNEVEDCSILSRLPGQRRWVRSVRRSKGILSPIGRLQLLQRARRMER
ncbi:glycosyltransferase family 2 protein [Methylobacterium durans]|uniref:glycosyltransferase family 2 protein n=1 Tax=Methylobacterium durans TaxID=2202825 RepID=UPI002AFF951B|nr:glycosyltransferase family 2 protein [Methylobacterium durans]MEA1835204.1 glycosyltransferase family 2 protein [Methylobacterium durans]